LKEDNERLLSEVQQLREITKLIAPPNETALDECTERYNALAAELANSQQSIKDLEAQLDEAHTLEQRTFRRLTEAEETVRMLKSNPRSESSANLTLHNTILIIITSLSVFTCIGFFRANTTANKQLLQTQQRVASLEQERERAKREIARLQRASYDMDADEMEQRTDTLLYSAREILEQPFDHGSDGMDDDFSTVLFGISSDQSQFAPLPSASEPDLDPFDERKAVPSPFTELESSTSHPMNFADTRTHRRARTATRLEPYTNGDGNTPRSGGSTPRELYDMPPNTSRPRDSLLEPDRYTNSRSSSRASSPRTLTPSLIPRHRKAPSVSHTRSRSRGVSREK
jgi:hypothetical protein